MGTITPEELLRRWAAEQIGPEQAIGQLVQHLARMQGALEAQRQTLVLLQGELARPRSGEVGAQAARVAGKR